MDGVFLFSRFFCRKEILEYKDILPIQAERFRKLLAERR